MSTKKGSGLAAYRISLSTQASRSRGHVQLQSVGVEISIMVIPLTDDSQMLHQETAKLSATIVVFVGLLVALLGALTGAEIGFVEPRTAVGSVALIWAGLVTVVAGRNIFVSRRWINHPRWFLFGCFWGLISVVGLVFGLMQVDASKTLLFTFIQVVSLYAIWRSCRGKS